MVARVLIIGGYGNFGTHIARRLAADTRIKLIIGGRNAEKARAFAQGLPQSPHPPGWCQMDYRVQLPRTLEQTQADIVIHTSGPFQEQDHSVAAHCIEAGCHYIDLADARDFVVGISGLDQRARTKGVLVVSGASSVPCLTAALIDHYKIGFSRIRRVTYGIATAQRTNRGLATTSAVLSYAGKPFKTLLDGSMQTVFGWQDITSKTLPTLGRRLFGNCDVPDLELFPKRYPDLETIRFHAALEVPFVHIGLWLLTWLVRWRLISSAAPLAPALLKISRLFDRLGSCTSAFYMELTGRTPTSRSSTLTFNLTAGSGDGLYIPCVPAVILARRLAENGSTQIGATPCVGIIDLPHYLAELKGLDIRWSDSAPD